MNKLQSGIGVRPALLHIMNPKREKCQQNEICLKKIKVGRGWEALEHRTRLHSGKVKRGRVDYMRGRKSNVGEGGWPDSNIRTRSLTVKGSEGDGKRPP